MQFPTFITYEVWSLNIASNKVLNFADKLHMQYNPFKTFSVSDTAEYMQET